MYTNYNHVPGYNAWKNNILHICQDILYHVYENLKSSFLNRGWHIVIHDLEYTLHFFVRKTQIMFDCIGTDNS